ncbi:CMD domain-containing protein [Aminobacter sp. Piv2-1]|uniref:CMD domain-containing protein n=1 Tax=Aminobacter sp. Piv2-1 TaxID=3031122 RepID=UPI0030976BCB
MIDAMDKAAGLSTNDAVFSARRFRPEFVEGAELCRISVLQPKIDQGLAPSLRVALAHRMAVLNADQALIAEYSALLAAHDPSAELLALAQGTTDLNEPLATIARHVDLITMTPIEAEASNIAKLAEAGLDNPQIVALSELIAFINFQTRVATGLRLMRSA